MKKYLLGIFCLCSTFFMGAEEYCYVENFEIIQGQELIQVSVKAHLDYYVSAWQVDFELPEGVSISHITEGEDINLIQTTQEGEQEPYEPSFMTGRNNTRVIILSSAQDYEKGRLVGVVKWSPGDYDDMFRITLKFPLNFMGGNMKVITAPGCGVDMRPNVIPTSDWINEKICTITVREDSDTPDIGEKKIVSEIHYYDFMGQELIEPKGVFITIITYTDKTTKVIKKTVSP